MPFPDSFEFRDFKRFNSDLFKMALDVVEWSPVFSSFDVNESLSRFLHIFNSVSDKHAPLKSFKVRNSASKPWITIGLKEINKSAGQTLQKMVNYSEPIISE